MTGFILWFLGALVLGTVAFAQDVDCGVPTTVIEAGSLGMPADYARDVECAQRLLARSAPQGFVLVVGSARLNEGHEQYARARDFAFRWTRKHPELPILTGGGPGLMEAANRGAREAGGKSLGFSTPFTKHGVEKPNPHMTDHLSFADFALRESWMISPARAIVVGSGGIGTGWEIFEALSKKQTGKISPIPIVFVGTAEEFAALQALLDTMVKASTIRKNDKELIRFAASVDEALAYVEKALSSK